MDPAFAAEKAVLPSVVSLEVYVHFLCLFRRLASNFRCLLFISDIPWIAPYPCTNFFLPESDLPSSRLGFVRSAFFVRVLFCDCNGSCHSFMAASTKIIAVKRECAHLLRYESQLGHFLRRNIGADSETRTSESMQSVQ
jgi:hypothetical protein